MIKILISKIQKHETVKIELLKPYFQKSKNAKKVNWR
jgi:hypothetical protein